MDEICEKPDTTITVEELFKLSSMLFECSKIMIKVDEEISRQLLELASSTLDRLNNDKFLKEDYEEIDDIAKEISSE